ncbi:MAG: hypothetical protein BYD32DRAFT_357780, partial [Podila humilis]
FPPVGRVPPVDAPQMHQWLSQVNLSGAPEIPLNMAQPGNPPTCLSKVPDSACNWLCDGCSADDVVDYPVKKEWATTFENGPTEATSEPLNVLKTMKVKATFFVIGGNVAEYPKITRYWRVDDNLLNLLFKYNWSHTAFTTGTNEVIAAEVRWTEMAILDATGHKVKYVRTPYGDFDNRIRYILKELGYTAVQWTRGP